MGQHLAAGFLVALTRPLQRLVQLYSDRETARRTSCVNPIYPVPRSAAVARYREDLEPIRKVHINDVALVSGGRPHPRFQALAIPFTAPPRVTPHRVNR